ncbi:MAG: hypothetical protein DMD26_12310 [Gemmatimonadetes bacterium]|nr:MAG: hypothetical protein DMD26_12310 [Gemmatimonadota bacterium]
MDSGVIEESITAIRPGVARESGLGLTSSPVPGATVQFCETRPIAMPMIRTAAAAAGTNQTRRVLRCGTGTVARLARAARIAAHIRSRGTSAGRL